MKNIKLQTLNGIFVCSIFKGRLCGYILHESVATEICMLYYDMNLNKQKKQTSMCLSDKTDECEMM